ncbi:universal stress protein [Micromonospora endophytica]|uniref:Universal stress protein UspA n=1 Tax=Micromonospora endophytica TaxID=515350 RepID=A0A2W2CN62_9ACTN|nr:universal stress protein [Micromonospora endophytica]PZG00916.1 universal stress protein UspA [Micromonospora endophytica]RIW46285.1 universal stress protein [Micromonospora endophytica]BCJ61774.1 universal stress protein [Micromonospora endophytica]
MTTTMAGASVVVCVDGSRAALDAVRVAAREAAYRHRPLRVVHAFIWPLMGVPVGPAPGGPPEGGLRHQAERYVADAVAQAVRVAPGVPVTGAVVDGAATPVLVGESRQAALMVLGHRGLGGVAGLLLGSVTAQVSSYALCPVLVVRGEPLADGPVLVGVDDSDPSAEAIGFAIEEAAHRRVPLVAVHAQRGPAVAHQAFPQSTTGRLERYPQVEVQHRHLRGAPAAVLLKESRAAQLVVVGARGRGPLGGLLLGSVSHTVLHHAHTPVAILRHCAYQR